MGAPGVGEIEAFAGFAERLAGAVRPIVLQTFRSAQA
jgi:hypothetical protein